MTSLAKTLHTLLAITVVASLAAATVNDAEAGPKKFGGHKSVSGLDLGSGR